MPGDGNVGFFMANIYFPGETVSGPLVVVISRESDALGVVSVFGSLETQFVFLALYNWLRKRPWP